MRAHTASNIIPLPLVKKFIKLDPELLTICHYHKTAIFLSYLIGLSEYWNNKIHKKYFYCTRSEQQKATKLSKFELEKSERECLEKGWIRKKKMGIPAKNHYVIVFETINQSLEKGKGTAKPRKYADGTLLASRPHRVDDLSTTQSG